MNETENETMTSSLPSGSEPPKKSPSGSARSRKHKAKPGTEQNPRRLRSPDGAEHLADDEYVTITVRQLRVLQSRDVVKPHSNTHLLHDNDPEVPANQPNWRDLNRLCFGTDPQDDRAFQAVKHYLGTVVNLSAHEKLVMLALNCLTDPMPVREIARAMRTSPQHVRRLKYSATKIMQAAPPAELMDERIRKARASRPKSLDE